MKKRLLNLFLALALVVLVLPMAADAASCPSHNKNNTTAVPAKAATCVATGNKAYWKCETCNKIFEAASTNPTSTSLKTSSVAKVTIAKSEDHKFTVNLGYRTGDEATCTEEGIFVIGCSETDCTATTAQTAPVNPNNHTYENGVCTGCGACRSNHASCEIVTRVKPVTCAEDGVRNIVYRCKDCKIYFCKNASGKYDYNTVNEFPDNVIPATGEHDFSVWQANVTPATCTKREVERYRCATCDETEEREVGPTPVGTHTPGKMTKYIKRPTCQETGEAEYECTKCTEKVTQTIRKLNCNIVALEAKDPTCVDTGLTAGTECATCKSNPDQDCAWCAAAGNLVPQTVVAALGHNQVLDTAHPAYKAATCDEGGMDVLDCTRCGYVDHQVPTEKLGHDWNISVLKEATCTIDGMEYHQCKREGCGDWKYVKITKLGHKKVDVPAVAPTCTATGLTVGEKCERCEKTFKAQSIVDKLAHAWEDVEAKAATCQEDGYNAHRACANCGETDGMTVIPANNTGHNYVNNKCTICGEYDPAHEHQGTGTVTTDSTCTTKGVKSFSCSGCDYTWTEDIAKKAHSYGADDRCTVCQKLNSKHEHSYAQTDYREPTCDIGGQVTKQCSVCGDTTQTTINALGHSYSNGKCIRCGTDAVCTHTNTTTRVQKEATCGTTGLKVTTCNSCGAQTATEVIPATGIHNHVNGVCSCGHRDESKVTSTLDNHGVYIVG